jgi:hypothetical protein
VSILFGCSVFFWAGCPFYLGVVFFLGGGGVHFIWDGLLLLEGWAISGGNLLLVHLSLGCYHGDIPWYALIQRRGDYNVITLPSSYLGPAYGGLDPKGHMISYKVKGQ